MIHTSSALRFKTSRRDFACLAVLAFMTVVVIVTSWYSMRDFLEPTTCQMSYMHPRYVPILLSSNSTSIRQGQPYTLYLFREAQIDPTDQLHGMPVLFVSGSAGSFRQVRSIASAVAFEERRVGITNLHERYDFFSVDFNEEFTGVHGESVREQARFLNDVLHHVLKLYKNPALHQHVSPPFIPPQSVFILGHSMGGLVARAMVTLPNFTPGSISHVFTISTPHMCPPATLELSLDQVYAESNYYWRHHFSEVEGSDKPLLDEVTIMSITGGNRDLIVNGDLIDVSAIAPPSHSLTVWTTGMPHVWTSTDHEAILWCSQIVRSIARGFIAIRQPDAPKRTLTVVDRMTTLKRIFTDVALEHLLINDDGRQTPSLPSLEGAPRKVVHDPRCSNMRQLKMGTTMRFKQKSDKASIFLLLSSEQVLEIYTNIQSSSILLCRSHQQDVCMVDCTPIPSDRFATLPTNAAVASQFLRLFPVDLAAYDVMIFDQASVDVTSFLHANMAVQQRIEVDTPLYELLWNGGALISLSPPSLFSSIHFSGITNNLYAFIITITSSQAMNTTSMPAVFRQYAPALCEDKLKAIDLSSGSNVIPLTFHGFNAPLGAGKNSLLRPRGRDEGLRMQLWLDPNYNYTVRVQLSLYGTLGQVFRRYLVVSVIFPFALLVLCFARQCYQYDVTGEYPTIVATLASVFQRTAIQLFVLFTVIALLQEKIVALLQDNTMTATLSASIFLGNDDAPWLLPVLVMMSFGMAAVFVGLTIAFVHLIAWPIGLLISQAMTPSRVLLMLRNEQSPSFSGMLMVVLLWLVVGLYCLFGPYHIAFLLCALLHMAFTIRSAILCMLAERLHCGGDFQARFHFNLSQLMIFVVLALPNVALAVAWARNQLPLHDITLFSFLSEVDRDAINVLPFAILGLLMTQGLRNRIHSRWLAWLASWPLRLLALVVFMLGVPYNYTLHYVGAMIAVYIAVLFIAVPSPSFSFNIVQKKSI